MRIKARMLAIVLFLSLSLGCLEENDGRPQSPVYETGFPRNEALADHAIEQTPYPITFEEGAKSTTNEISTFIPLGDNERFAYSVRNVQNEEISWRRRWDISLYALENDDIENARKLFSWKHVGANDIQFTDGLRMGFFISRNIIDWGRNWTFDLYKVNGHIGEVTRLAADVSSLWRVSGDGRYIGFLGGNHFDGYVNVFVFDVKARAIAGEFEWRTVGPIDIDAWFIVRRDDAFIILGSGLDGRIFAATELNLGIMELKTLWDKTDARGVALLLLPNILDDDSEWQDDVWRQSMNPLVMLP